jgi:N-acetylated-alpha-linked acidic dipeptidase
MIQPDPRSATEICRPSARERPLVVTAHGPACACLILLVVSGALGAQPNTIRGFFGASAAREREMEALLAQRVNRDSTHAAFRLLTAEPHPAGSSRNKYLADWIATKWRAYGLEDITLHRYDVYLPWPKEVSVTMMAPTRYAATLREDVMAVDPDTKLDPGPTYLGMSASGDVTAALVYASSGNPEDYDWLESRGVDLKGKIALVRYSVPYSYRGYKALVAQQRGIKALLIYSDPQEDGYRKGLTFPDGPYGPESHIQRGSITYDFIVPGDPLTPGWASVEGARRIPVAEAKNVPTIVMVPLSWRDAKPLLETLTGVVAPPSWQGALPFTYRVGPGPATVRVKVAMDDSVRAIWVVEGRIRGSEEPDKYVVLGNHRDAWVFGGVDPSSGTATQLELARVLGGLAREGKRPRRTIVFASWDAEEWHLTGSTEWGEQFAEDLRQNGVAYLNVDGSTSGANFSVGTVASLNRLVVETARDVLDPATGKSLLAAWGVSLASARDRVIGGGASRTTPTAQTIDYPGNALGSGSDYTVFLNFLGIPIVEMSFDGPYGVYHSMYDDYYWMTHFGDPGFRYMTAMSEIWGRMTLRLANCDVYPFDFALYASRVGRFVDSLAKEPAVTAHLNFDAVHAAQRRWLAAGRKMEAAQRAALATSESRARRRSLAAMNDALRAVEQQLLLAEGIPGRPWFRHALYAPRFTYAAMTLPGIQEAVDEKNWGRAREQAAALAARLNAAARMVEHAAALAPR